MTDDDYHDFVANNKLNKPIAPKQTMVAQIFEGVSELAGSIEFGQSLFRFGALIKQLKFRSSKWGKRLPLPHHSYSNRIVNASN
jgi:hypothetical protein